MADKISFRETLKSQYGLTLSRAQTKKLITKISQGKAQLIREHTPRLSVYQTKISGKSVLLIFDTNKQRLVTTILPKAEVTALSLRPSKLIHANPRLLRSLEISRRYEG